MTNRELIEKLSEYDSDLEIMTDAVDLDTNNLMAVTFVYIDEFYDEAKNLKKVICLETEVGKMEFDR